MKRFKKLLSSMLTLFICFSLSTTPVFASVNSKNKPLKTKSVFNEYLELKKLKQKTEKELLQAGYTKEEYKAIQDLDNTFSKHINDLKKYSDKELKDQRFSDEQIEAIRNFDGSEKMMIQASAVCSIWLWCSSFSYSSPYTYVTLEYSYDWQGTPSYMLDDCFGVGWNCGLYVQSRSLTVHYTGYQTSTTEKYYGTVQGVGNCGISIPFPLSITYNDVICTGYTGDGKVTLRKQESIQEFGAKAVYAHSYLFVSNPSIGVSISGDGPNAGITFTISENMSDEDECYINPQLSDY